MYKSPQNQNLKTHVHSKLPKSKKAKVNVPMKLIKLVFLL